MHIMLLIHKKYHLSYFKPYVPQKWGPSLKPTRGWRGNTDNTNQEVYDRGLKGEAADVIRGRELGLLCQIFPW